MRSLVSRGYGRIGLMERPIRAQSLSCLVHHDLGHRLSGLDGNAETSSHKHPRCDPNIPTRARNIPHAFSLSLGSSISRPPIIAERKPRIYWNEIWTTRKRRMLPQQ
jgi:hypothetical protein